MVKNILAIPLVLILLGGCGGGAMMVKPDAVNEVNTVTLLKAPEPVYRIIDLGSPAAAMGAVGALINASQMDFESLGELLESEDYSFSDHLIEDISSQLEKSGFKVKVVDVQRDEPELLEDYGAIDINGSDAVLDVVVSNAGYVTEHFMFSPEFRPEARVVISMRSVASNEAIYEETIMYGYHNPLMSATDLDAPPERMYESTDELFMEGTEVIVAGLQQAAQSIASHVATQLRKQN